MKLLFASTNQGKLSEVNQILSNLKINLLSISDFQKLQNVVVEETGERFEDNALLKAKAYGDLTQIMTLAEDSGLEVAALDGQPGVYSARFGSSVDERNQKLLSMMKDKKNRSARFVSVFCLYDPQTQKTNYFRGVVQGLISRQTSGKKGFGYDPVFIPLGYQQTFAKLGDKIKNQVSHRKKALEQVKEYLVNKNG